MIYCLCSTLRIQIATGSRRRVRVATFKLIARKMGNHRRPLLIESSTSVCFRVIIILVPQPGVAGVNIDSDTLSESTASISTQQSDT